MAASFKIGQVVALKAVTPTGPVLKLSVSPEGEIQYLVGWVDKDGIDQETWFKEEDLNKA
jgi:uncharacterized protein YodC (DUF2158 family)